VLLEPAEAADTEAADDVVEREPVPVNVVRDCEEPEEEEAAPLAEEDVGAVDGGGIVEVSESGP